MPDYIAKIIIGLCILVIAAFLLFITVQLIRNFPKQACWLYGLIVTVVIAWGLGDLYLDLL